MTRTQLARSLALATVVFGIAFYTLAAAITPGYSPVSNFLSELNATGMPYAGVIGLAGWLPLATLFAAFLLAARPLARVEGVSRAGLWLLWSQPLAFLGVLLAPCDLGCPAEGSPSQGLHNLIALVTYLAGGIGLLLLACAPALTGPKAIWRNYFVLAGCAWGLLFVLMLMPELAPWRGLLQRGADALLGGAVLVIAWQLLPGGEGPATTQR